MKHIDFEIIDGHQHPVHSVGIVEEEAHLPVAIMEAVNEFLEITDGHLELPLKIEIRDHAPVLTPHAA